MTKLCGSALISLTAFVMFAIALPAGAYTVCDEDKIVAAHKLVGANDRNIEAMERARAIPRLPDFGSRRETLDKAVRASYLADRNDAALAIYGTDSTHVCVFLFTRNEMLYARTPMPDIQLNALMKQLTKALKVVSTWSDRSAGRSLATDHGIRRSSRANSVANVLNASLVKQISDFFFPPVLRKELVHIRHFSIVPIGGMSAVPVALLEPLGDGRKVVELFSVNFLAFLADVDKGTFVWPRKFNRALVVGNPRPSDDPDKWPSLEGAEEEAKIVHGGLGGMLLLREKATKSAILQNISDSDLVYFAAHGYSDLSGDLGASYIVLGDGPLTAREVQQLKLRNSPIVVLSACQTGEGGILEAGIIGIARGFQIAGASNTIMSLWQVDDRATKELMGYFVRGLSTLPPAEALRVAMLKLRKKDTDPAHWAAFNVFGNAGTLTADRN